MSCFWSFWIGVAELADHIHAPSVANTYSRIYIQVVFAVEARQYLIRSQFKEEVQKLLAVHCMPDHTHLLIGLKPSTARSDLVRDIKNASSNLINRKGWVMGRFSWQEGFGAFSYGHSQISTVIRYIHNQAEHHARRSFREEYLQFLRKFEIDHEERFMFRDLSREPG